MNNLLIDPAEYEALCAPFDNVQKLKKGGVELDYVAAEDIVTRLNTVLGIAGWSFRIIDHGYNTEADSFWALGELTVNRIDPQGNLVPVLTRMQFGGEAMKRRTADQRPLDIGFDMKSAATDALKKCATLIGVALYLSHKEPTPIRIAAPTSRDVAPRAERAVRPPDLGPAVAPPDDAPAAPYWRERYRALLDRASACDLDLRPYEIPEGVTQGALNALGKKLRLVVEEAEASQVITFPEEGGNGARRGN
jgi:hypothetical protein